jgi:cbb3-type cytochrome oxidase cytochrome c subunit
MEKTIKISIIIAIISATLIAIYATVFLTRQAKEAEDLKQQTQLQEVQRQAYNKLQLQNCLSSTYQAYVAQWNNACAAYYMSSGCSLPIVSSDAVNRDYNGNRESCFKQFPQ